ncbi:hypothetical protein ABIF73_004437 [Bradyrhizobium japonicum]|uniref:hypothetical protein n=1 Tax=Bradyrhizobium japonicum TaxID=375 RepID=UPI00339394C8
MAMGTDRISQELWPVTTYRVFGFKDRLIGMYTLHQEARTEPILGYPPSPRMYRVEVIQFERGDLTKWLTFSTNHPTADKITNVVANGKKITLQTCK